MSLFLSLFLVSKSRQNLSNENLKNDLKNHIFIKKLCDAEEKLKENKVRN